MTYQEFKEAVIRIASKMKVEDYELYYMESDSTSVEIFKEEVSGYETEESMGICFRCIVDGKAGYASTENLDEEEAESLVVRALENAASIEEEEPCFLHKKGDTYAKCEEVKESTPSGAELTDAAMCLQKEMYQADSRIVDGTQAYVGHGGLRCALYNSNGLDLEDKASYSYCYGMALASDGKEMYNGGKQKFGNLKDFNMKEIAQEAVEDTVSTIGADSVASGKYNIVFSGRVMATLLSTYTSVFSAEQAQKGMSLLQGKEGETIAVDAITIVDDPMHKDCVIKRTFDGEGVATYTKNVVEDGKLITLLHNLKTAAKAGVKSTGNASKASYASVVGVSPFNFYIRPVKGTKEEFFEIAQNGIYVTEISGLHAGANPITGDFSLSSKGFLISDGKKAAAVKEFTVSGNFFTLLKEIERVGEDLEFLRGRIGAPSVLVRNMAVAGK
jgi:PmbA protein